MLGWVPLPTVPQRHSSYSALRLPAPSVDAPVLPCVLLPRIRRLSFSGAPTLTGPPGDLCPAPPLAAFSEELTGPPRLLGRPLSARPMPPTPAPATAPHPFAEQTLLPSRALDPWADRYLYFSGPTHRAHTFACLRFNRSVTDAAARLTTGLPGSALAGWDSHPLDDSSIISRRHRSPPIPVGPALPGRYQCGYCELRATQPGPARASEVYRS